MKDFGVATQNFIKNHLGDIKQDLAVAIIKQFGGEDELMHEYVIALPDSIELNNVQAFNDNNALVELYNTHKRSIIDLSWKYGNQRGFSTPVSLYASLKGLSGLRADQISAGMHNQDSDYHNIVASEIFKFSAEQLCIAWADFTKKQDDFGEQLFNMYHG